MLKKKILLEMNKILEILIYFVIGKIKNIKIFILNIFKMEIQIIDYYRCIDTFSEQLEDLNIDDIDIENDDIYTQENSNQLSKIYPMMIKIFGKTIYGKSICVNVQDFYPYFYISIIFITN